MTPPKCGATNRDGDPCSLPAGWGTNHTGEGRCRLHGGSGNQEKAFAERFEKGLSKTTTAIHAYLDHLLTLDPSELTKDQAKLLEKLFRSFADRTGHGPTETRELTGKDGDAIRVQSNVVEVTEATDDDDD